MREVKIPNTECVAIVAPNGHLHVYVRDIFIMHIQFKVNATDEEVILAVKHCMKIKD